MIVAILFISIITLVFKIIVLFWLIRIKRKVGNDIKKMLLETNDLIKRRTAIINSNLSDMDATLDKLKNGVVVLSTDETIPFGVKYE